METPDSPGAPPGPTKAELEAQRQEQLRLQAASDKLAADKAAALDRTASGRRATVAGGFAAAYADQANAMKTVFSAQKDVLG